MSEDGINSGGRNFGRLCLAFVPYALALGAAAWFGLWLGVHQERRRLSQEDRAAIYTAAQERPKGKMAVEVLSRSCVTLTKVDIDGTMLLLYGRNDCHQHVRYVAWHWQVISPNRTVVKDGYENGCPIPSEPGDSAECNMDINTDDRANSLRVWTEP